ncbi:MAG: hypothetical protein ACSHX8_06710 [Opitutaceae bacterium]
MRLLRFILLWILLCPSIFYAEEIISAENSYFEVIGTDSRSVSYVGELAAHIATQCNQHLLHQETTFPQKVFIALMPKDRVEFPGAHRLSIGAQGVVRLDYRWDKHVDLKSLCLQITEAYLSRYAFYHYGPNAPKNLSAWSVHALALESYLQLHPASIVKLVEDSAGKVPTKLADLLSTPVSEVVDVEFRSDAYYLLNAFLRSAKRPVTRKLLDVSLSGAVSGDQILQYVLPVSPIEAAIELETWWPMVREEALSYNSERFESMPESSAWIERMIDFESYTEGGNSKQNLRVLWAIRENADLRIIIESRRELIRLRLHATNPCYYNVAQSLGVCYDLMLQEDIPEYRFTHALVKYLRDFDDAKEVERAVSEILDSM